MKFLIPQMNFTNPNLKFFLAASILFFISSCKNNSGYIPFPANETEFPQPVTKPLKISEPEKIKWVEPITGIKPLVKEFNFNKLPIKTADSSGFVPFSKPAVQVTFNYNNLPDTIFNYDKLPSKPFQFETQILPPPTIIKPGHPFLKTSGSSLLLEFGEPFAPNKIFILFEDKKGFIWIAAKDGLYRYDGENLLLYLKGFNFNNSDNIIEDDLGQLWIPTFGNGLLVINTKAGIIKRLGISQGLGSYIGKILLDPLGRIWATNEFPNTSTGGLASGFINIIDQHADTMKQLGRAQGLSLNLPTFGLTMDNQNNIWIPSYDNGINIIDFKQNKIKYLDKNHGLSTNSLSTLYSDDHGSMFSASWEGQLDKINFQKGIITHFYNEQGLKKNIAAHIDNSTGKILIGSIQSGLEIIDENKNA